MRIPPKVSIVTTVRGTAAPLIGISIESILSQSLSDLELVLVLDGDLPDDAETVVREAQAADDRVVVVRPGRVGRGRALNLGLETARAELVGIQDADDASHHDRVAVQYDILRCEPALALLATGARVSWGAEITAEWPLDAFGDPLTFRRLDRELLRSNPIIHSGVLARADDLKRVGGYDVTRVAQLDYDLLLRLRANGAMIGITEIPLVLHRRHPGQAYEGMAPYSRAWGSYRLQSSHLSDLTPPTRAGYQAIAATRLVYQIGRGMAWHRASRHRSGTPG